MFSSPQVPPAYKNVYMDSHLYLCYSAPYINQNVSRVVKSVCDNMKTLVKYSRSSGTVVGEWSMETAKPPPYPYSTYNKTWVCTTASTCPVRRPTVVLTSP